MRSFPVAVACLLLAMSAPTGVSTWGAGGTYEPDTVWDDARHMWAGAAAPGEDRVYFNAITTATVGGRVSVSPNVALLRTANEAPASEYSIALLGVWKDCNGDGYVGMAEHALPEYSAALLLSTTICPGSNGPPNAWRAGAHNYNGWVSEYVPIGPTTSPLDQRIYRDPEAMVWGDLLRPDDPAGPPRCAFIVGTGVIDSSTVQDTLCGPTPGVPQGKRRADSAFSFEVQPRGGNLYAFVVAPGWGGAPSGEGGATWATSAGSGWYSDWIWTTKPGPRIVHYDVEAVVVEFAEAHWLSFYASVGHATIDRGFAMTEARGTYGAAQCDGATNGIFDGWNCDPNQWNLDGNGNPLVRDYRLARVGDPWMFRDVDCYDGQNDLGVPLGGPAYGIAPCGRV